MRNCPVCEQGIESGLNQCPHCGSVFGAPTEASAANMHVMGPMGASGASIVSGGIVDPFDMKSGASMAEFSDIPFDNAAEVIEEMEAEANGRSGRSAIIGRIVFIVILAGLIITALYFGLSSLSVIRATTDRLPAATAPPETEPEIARQNVDGVEGYLLTMYGRDGDHIYLKSLNRTLSIEDGKAEVFLPLSSLIPQEPLGAVEALNIELEALLYPVTGGTEEPLSLPVLSVPVPKTPLEIVYPSANNLDSLRTPRNEMEISLITSPGARLSVNGTELTVPPADKEAGLYKFPVPLMNIGENVFTISASQIGHASSEYTVVINRFEQLVELNLDDGVAGRVSGLVLGVSGRAEPGAEISCSYEMDNLTVDYETGEFSADVILPAYGLHEFDIVAARQGEESHWTHKVYSYPDMEEYTRSAWALDYDEAYKNPSKFLGRAFAFSGEIIRLEGSERVTVMMYIDSDPDKPVSLSYEGGAELREGQLYKVFADSAGTAEFGVPAFAARFIFEQ